MPAPNDAEGEGKQLLFIVRHGDRYDYSHPEWVETAVRPGDPPMSKLGHQQARETGAFLDSVLFEEGIPPENITWLSSPFLRCLQTSTDALNQFTKVDSKNVQILPEYSVFEMDGHGGQQHKDLPPVAERAHYFPRVNIGHESLFVPELPEKRSDLVPRCEKAMKLFNSKYAYTSRSAFVIVTHAAGCIGLAKSASELCLKDITPASPCCVFQLTRTSQTDKWSLDAHDIPGSRNGYVDHISDMGTTTTPWNHFGTNKSYSGPPDSRFAHTRRKEAAYEDKDTTTEN